MAKKKDIPLATQDDLAVVDLLQDKRLWTVKPGETDPSPRNKAAFLRLLRDVFHCEVPEKRFLGRNMNRPLATITKKQAATVLKTFEQHSQFEKKWETEQ